MGGHTNSSSSFFTPLTTGVSASFFLDCGCSALCFADAISARHGIALFSCDPNPGKSSCDCDTHGHARRKVSALRLELLEIGFSLSPKTTTRKPADSASVSSFVHADPRTWAVTRITLSRQTIKDGRDGDANSDERFNIAITAC